jgi:negative regulator of replication initiation
VITHNIFYSLSLCSVGTCSVLFSYSKEQETAKGDNKKEKNAAVQETTAVQDTVVVQNIYPSTFLPMEEMSESYMTINTFSQILTVIFQTNTPVF